MSRSLLIVQGFRLREFLRIWPLLVVVFLGATLVVPPDADASDKKVVFGRIKVSLDSGESIELDKPGVFKSGDMFLLWVLNESEDEATRIEADESGDFLMKLEAGNYVVASYEWSRNAGGAAAGGTFRGDRLWAGFSVSNDADATYIGTLSLTIDENRRLEIAVEDESDEASSWLAGGSDAADNVATSLLTIEDQPWRDTGVPICIAGFGISCDEHRRGVEVEQPKQTRSRLFRSIKTLTPILEWKPSTTAEISYDVIVYRAYYQKAGFLAGGGKPGGGYEAGRVVEYVEGLTEPRHSLQEPLEPGGRYLWSVRLRHPQAVSSWSTRRVDTMEGLRTVIKYNELYGMRTRDKRRSR